MEITTVIYRVRRGQDCLKYRGSYSVVEGGIVLYISAFSQFFVPYHMIDSIEQTFTSSVPADERKNKSLISRHRRA